MSTLLHIGGKAIELESLARKGGEISFSLNGKTYRFRGLRQSDGSLLLEEETTPGVWKRQKAIKSAGNKGASHVQLAVLEASILQGNVTAADATKGALSPLAPMPALVRQVLVKTGDTVKNGQALIVVEAMKLQLTLSAGGDATVEQVLVSVGQLVPEGAELVRLKEKA